ncbi:MAG: hypothetical protein HWE15_13555 [Algoriphagus sp.]|nr:hypothetical protein [Algoriphagus sp.]
MRKYFFVLSLLFPFLSLAQEDIEYKEFSYTELFKMIENEEDTVFKLENARIIFNPETDKDFIIDIDFSTGTLKPRTNNKRTINKRLEVSKVEFTELKTFQYRVGLNNIRFKKSVSLPGGVLVINCLFEETARFSQSNNLKVKIKSINDVLMLIENTFNGSFHVSSDFFSIISNEINGSKSMESMNLGTIYGKEGTIQDNVFNNLILKIETDAITSEDKVFSEHVLSNYSTFLNIEGNSFFSRNTEIIFDTKTDANINFKNNKFEGSLLIDAKPLTAQNIDIRWSQFPKELYDIDAYEKSLPTLQYGESIKKEVDTYYYGIKNPKYRLKYLENFQDSLVSNDEAFLAQMNALANFHTYYKTKHDSESANLVYIRLKDTETRRLAHIYSKDPSFKSFFTWKINQFLKTFSAYGTEPARAIIFSFYVIIVFALIYLFFPNHWDSHGKNRIMDRYRFFAKYMKKDSGIHEVYLDEKREEMMAAEDFRAYMLESKQEIPGFFMATALPLYRWSVAGTRTFSWLLSKVDVLKGTWSSTEDSKKAGKSVLIIGAFLIAIVYDIFIKMLNALMLSINTFTTLGFGEIPIKGLPRYLAIIQGFIGWFMLTIFSVSLISQLLN